MGHPRDNSALQESASTGLTQAVVILQADPHRAAGFRPLPLPTGHCGDTRCEVDFFTKVDIHCRAVYHNLWDFWTRVLAAWFATGHYHAETTAGMLMVVGETVSEP